MNEWFAGILEATRPGRPGFYIASLALITLAYFLVLLGTTGRGVGDTALNSFANVLPIAVGGAALRALWRGLLNGRGPAATILAHILLAAAFSIFWFWLLMVLLGATSGGNPFIFSVVPFMGPAAAWQLMQGLLLYALIAMAIHVEQVHEQLAGQRGTASGEAATKPVQRPFVKDGDDIRPLDPDRIIQISGADDYSEVRTVSGTHMLRTTLAELERALGDGFLRIHRSHIVNVDRIARIEPAGGGRLSLHMEGGESVVASRSGAKAIRERML